MLSEIWNGDIGETNAPEAESFRNIKPESPMDVSDANKYWDDLFNRFTPSKPETSRLADVNNLKKPLIESIQEYGEKSFRETVEKEKAENKTIEAENPEKGHPIQNKIDGLAREHDVENELREQYPEEAGYEIVSEAYLRDKDGKIVKDEVTGEARRIDFVVIKGKQVVDSIEVTSMTADKTLQVAKENRIRDTGGNFIKDGNGNLVEIPSDIKTRIERRD